MLRIFIAHPLAGDTTYNLMEMRRICAEVAQAGDLPICPALYCTSFLDESDPAQRALGLKLSLEMLADCDRVWAYGHSEGVSREAQRAREMKIQIVWKLPDLAGGED